MDSATSEYLFCHDFWAGDQTIFREVFAPAVAAVEENLGQFLANCVDMSGIIIMVRTPDAAATVQPSSPEHAHADSHQPRAPGHHVPPPGALPGRILGPGARGSVSPQHTARRI